MPLPPSMFDKTRPVLVVDDCPMYRTAARGMLQLLGFEQGLIDLAQDAATALQLCRGKPYQLVLCDYNLGRNEMNGHQLLDEVLHCTYLPIDCVVIIVTGDASAEVVRNFMELNPDGYLVKPLNFKILSDRLPRLSRRKRTLSPLLDSFSRGHYTEAVQQADETLEQNTELSHAAMLLKAQALIELGDYNQAHNLLVTLRSGPESNRATLELAKVALRQRHYQLCLTTLGPLEHDPLHCAAALAMAAEACIREHQLDKAHDKISLAIEKNPRQVERYWLKAYIEMAEFRLDDAIDSLSLGLRYAKHSFREDLTMQQLAASLILDMAMGADREKKRVYLNRFTELCRYWRSNFQRPEYKPVEFLLLSRAYGIRGMYSKAKEHLDEYQQLIEGSIELPSLDRNQRIELAKVKSQLNDMAHSERLISEQMRILSEQNDQAEHVTLRCYLGKWRERVEQQRRKATQLKQLGLSHIKEGHHAQSLEYLIAALELDQNDAELPQLVISTLRHGWPQGWNKREVTELALRCRDLQINSSSAQSKEFKDICRELAGTLALNEGLL